MDRRDGHGAAVPICPVRDRLPNPPIGVGGEAVATRWVVPLHRRDQTQVGGLDQIIVAVALGQPVAVLRDIAHRQAQVGFDESTLGTLTAAADAWRATIWKSRMVQPCLDGSAELDLLRWAEQRIPTNRLQPPAQTCRAHVTAAATAPPPPAAAAGRWPPASADAAGADQQPAPRAHRLSG